jgi:glycosyltransferase involved in cell wall biosynthesis
MSTDTRTNRVRSGRSQNRRSTDLLIVGTLGGGGIHQYVEEQAERLSGDLSVTVYDMASDSTGSGLVWFVVSLVRSLWAALRFPFRTPPDVVHVHTSHRFSFYRASFYVLFAAHVWRRPVILHVHGSSFDEFVETDDAAVRRLQSAVFAASDRIVVLSAYWREVLASRVPDGKIRVVPNAVDPGEYDPGFGDDPPHVVFVSNLIERKGVPELLEAIEALQDRDVEFRVTIAGKGPLSGAVEDLAARHENVEYRGYVSEPEKRALLGSGAVFVLPAHAEGLPIAMLEGMAGGNAIVSTTVGSIPEVVDERSGILIEPGDVEGLTDAIGELIASPERTGRMARRNRELIEAKYSWATATDRLEEMYAECEDDTGRGDAPVAPGA